MTPEQLTTDSIPMLCQQIEFINLGFRPDADMLYNELSQTYIRIERDSRLEPHRCNVCYQLHLYKPHHPGYHLVERHYRIRCEHCHIVNLQLSLISTIRDWLIANDLITRSLNFSEASSQTPAVWSDASKHTP